MNYLGHRRDGGALVAWGAFALCILTGGAVDYLPGARRPWLIEAFGRQARGRTLDEVLNRLMHRPGRVIHSSEREALILADYVEMSVKKLLEISETCGKSRLVWDSYWISKNLPQRFPQGRDGKP